MGMPTTFTGGSLSGTVEITTSRKVYTGFVKNVISTRFEFRLGTMLQSCISHLYLEAEAIWIFLICFCYANGFKGDKKM